MKLHATDLGTLARCGVQFYYRRVEGIIVPPAIALVVGKATHKAVETNMQAKLATGQMAEREAIDEIGKASVKGDFERGVTLDDDEKGVAIEKLRGQAEDKTVRLSGVHYSHLAPVIVPKFIERQWVLELPEEPMDLCGRIDLQEEDCVRDTKTASKTPPLSVAGGSMQLTVYALAARIMDGVIPTKFTLDNLVDLKTPKAVVHETTRTMADIESLLARVKAVMRAIKAGNFIPADPTSWCCAPRWCGFWSRCPYARAPVAVRVDGMKEE